MRLHNDLTCISIPLTNIPKAGSSELIGKYICRKCLVGGNAAGYRPAYGCDSVRSGWTPAHAENTLLVRSARINDRILATREGKNQPLQGATSYLNPSPRAHVPGVAPVNSCVHIPLETRMAGLIIRHGGNGRDGNRLSEEHPCSPVPQPRQQADPIRTLVAMPAYNEEASIAKTVLGARQHADAVLVVDDGSNDETAWIAGALGAIVLRHEVNRGYGGALQTIFDTAREMGVEELVVIDADGQHDPGDVPRLLAELRVGKDIVIGSRYAGGSGEGIPAYRKVGMKVLDTATTLAGNGLSITDSQSGFRAYGRRAIEAIRINDDGMSAGSEILIQASDHRLHVAEVPIEVRYDIEGTSSENPVLHGVGVLMNVVRLISLRRPLIFFGIPGTLFALAGVAAEIYTFSEYYRAGTFHYIIFTGGFSMLILGLLLAAVGVILYSLVQIIEQRSKADVSVALW